MLIETLRSDALTARKAAVGGDAAASGRATLLTTVIAAADATAKNDGQRVTNDGDATSALRKMLKGVEDSLGLVTDTSRRSKLSVEQSTLKGYLPTMLEGDDLRLAVIDAAEFGGVPVEMRSMKVIVGHLNELYPGRIDGKAVSDVIRAFKA